MTALRQKPPLAGSKSNLRFTPESRLNSDIAPKSAHKRTIRQVCRQILSTLLHPQSRSTALQRYLAIAAL
jgi:hypothetical protein